MKEETSMNIWKALFLNEIRFLTRNDDLRKVAGNWTWPESGPHTVSRLLTPLGSLVVGSFFKKETFIDMKHLGFLFPKAMRNNYWATQYCDNGKLVQIKFMLIYWNYTFDSPVQFAKLDTVLSTLGFAFLF